MNPTHTATPAAYPLLPVERKPAGEDAAIAEMLAELQGQLTRNYVAKGLLVRRDAHPKHHGGLVRATLKVGDDCPEELRHGIFVPGREYPAFLRFSNGDPKVKHDLEGDVRGLAIKLTGDVRPSMLGEHEHDLLLATGEAFFGRDAVDYRGFPAASVSWPKLFRYFVPRRVRAGMRLLSGLQVPSSPLSPNYFSQVPYRLGPHCVKYLVRRRGLAATANRPLHLRAGVRHALAAVLFILRFLESAFKLTATLPWHDASRNELVRELSEVPVLLDVFAQRWPDLSNLPVWAIEDATRTWTAPFAKVATIEIPPQTAVEICSRKEAAEHWSFHPWRVAPEHQPLGGISRARLAVYSAMSAFRNEQNNRRPAP
jgi:hypothetical protein